MCFVPQRRAIFSSLSLPHTRHATLLYVLSPFHSHVMLLCSPHASCYAAVVSPALPHTHVMLRCCTFFCTCPHTSCYAAVRSFALQADATPRMRCVVGHVNVRVNLPRKLMLRHAWGGVVLQSYIFVCEKYTCLILT